MRKQLYGGKGRHGETYLKQFNSVSHAPPKSPNDHHDEGIDFSREAH
jgi:hypothetical protein